MSSTRSIARVLKRLKHRGLSRGFVGWTNGVQIVSQAEAAKRTSARLVSRSMRHILHRLLAQGWQAWAFAVRQTRSCDTDRASSLALLSQTVRRWKKRKLAEGYSSWVLSTHESFRLAERRVTSLKRMYRSVCHMHARRISLAWHKWVAAVRDDARRADVGAANTKPRTPLDTQRDRMIKRAENRDLCRGFEAINSLSYASRLADGARTRSARLVARVATRSQRRCVSKYWRTWVLAVREHEQLLREHHRLTSAHVAHRRATMAHAAKAIARVLRRAVIARATLELAAGWRALTAAVSAVGLHAKFKQQAAKRVLWTLKRMRRALLVLSWISWTRLMVSIIAASLYCHQMPHFTIATATNSRHRLLSLIGCGSAGASESRARCPAHGPHRF